jgi:hypothetical protein
MEASNSPNHRRELQARSVYSGEEKAAFRAPNHRAANLSIKRRRKAGALLILRVWVLPLYCADHPSHNDHTFSSGEAGNVKTKTIPFIMRSAAGAVYVLCGCSGNGAVSSQHGPDHGACG